MHAVPPPRGSENHPAGKHSNPGPLPYNLEELEAIVRLLTTLDDMQTEQGTHLLGPARFVIHDPAGTPRNIMITHPGDGSWHLLGD